MANAAFVLGAGFWEAAASKRVHENDGTGKLGALERMVHKKPAFPAHSWYIHGDCFEGRFCEQARILHYTMHDNRSAMRTRAAY